MINPHTGFHKYTHTHSADWSEEEEHKYSCKKRHLCAVSMRFLIVKALTATMVQNIHCLIIGLCNNHLKFSQPSPPCRLLTVTSHVVKQLCLTQAWRVSTRTKALFGTATKAYSSSCVHIYGRNYCRVGADQRHSLNNV